MRWGTVCRMMRLADVAIVLSGAAPKAEGRGHARFVRIKDLTPERRTLSTGVRPTAKRAVPIEVGDVLVAARGEGDLAVRPDAELVGAFAGLDLYLLRPDPDRLDPDYLVSFLNSEAVTGLVRASASRGSLPRVPKDALTELLVPVPTLARQMALGRMAACMDRHRMLARKKLAAEQRWFQACLEQAFTELRG